MVKIKWPLVSRAKYNEQHVQLLQEETVAGYWLSAFCDLLDDCAEITKGSLSDPDARAQMRVAISRHAGKLPGGS